MRNTETQSCSVFTISKFLNIGVLKIAKKYGKNELKTCSYEFSTFLIFHVVIRWHVLQSHNTLWIIWVYLLECEKLKLKPRPYLQQSAYVHIHNSSAYNPPMARVPTYYSHMIVKINSNEATNKRPFSLTPTG